MNQIVTDSNIGNTSGLLLRILAGGMIVLVLLFLFNNYLIFWRGWPGVLNFSAHQGWLGLESLSKPLEGDAIRLGWLQVVMYLAAIAGIVVYVFLTRQRSLNADADLFSAFAAYIVRAAFWAVLLIGLVDMLISFLRVEGFLEQWVGADLNKELGRSRYRGAAVHYPLIALSLIIALFVRSLGFIWLALLVVIAEFQIVVTRFIFSYEQAFMGDLVRFWYAALFLFASSYALITEGHVRVDVFYAHFSAKGRAWTNALGSLLLGLPLCWTILIQGLWGKGNSINSPLLSYEISQSGYGMYVKYLMAGFLVVFALSMIIQFVSYFLSNTAVLRGEPETVTETDHAELAEV